MKNDLCENIDSEDNEKASMITPSEIIEYVYCPRFVFYMNCLNIVQHEELRYKVLKGRDVHIRREKINKEYLRRKLGVVRKDNSVYLASRNLRVRGIVDEVLFLDDGSLAPLDFKYAQYNEKIFITHKIQSILYALLIMENYKKSVTRGFICYERSRGIIKEILFKKQDFEWAESIVGEIFDILYKGYYPKATKFRNRCIDCCYRNICIH